jgi:chemotaxis protein CheX
MNAFDSALSSGAGRECWLPTLQLSVQEVFSLMLGCELSIAPESTAIDGLDITAMVGLAGELCGILTARCSGKSAAHMASVMLGIDPDQAGPQMWDAVGEVCNMVAGNFKNKINGLGDGCMLSVPTVITGGDYSLHPMANSEICTVLLFQGEPIMFSLEVHG